MESIARAVRKSSGLRRRAIAPPGQEGWTRHQEKYREASFDGADGVVVQDQTEMFLNLNHHPVCAASDASHFLLTGAATPSWPRGDGPSSAGGNFSAKAQVGTIQMKRISLFLFLTTILLLDTAWVAYTQNARTPAQLRIAKVKGDLYMISGEGGNVAVYVTSEGVILVDDMFDRNHADILAQVKSVTDKPIRYVLNTHQHDDHAGGDMKMLPIAEVIAHNNARANLADIKQPYYEDTPGTPIGLPRLTFTDEFSVHLGGKEVRAKYFGRGHTNGDVIVYFPELKVDSHRRSLPRTQCTDAEERRRHVRPA